MSTTYPSPKNPCTPVVGPGKVIPIAGSSVPGPATIGIDESAMWATPL